VRKLSNVKKRFARIPNETIDDVNLDFVAGFLLVILLRQKDGWDITIERIARKYGHAEYPLANAMGLLQVLRYVFKLRVQKTSGEWVVYLVVSDVPVDDEGISDFMDGVADEYDVAEVRFIEPPQTAVRRFEERRQKRGF
jgi:hypothetical protein